jgi:regulator of sirC expression with transglutaminase-like and TPR domain
MNACSTEFYSLLRLLDDETPAVRQTVGEKLREYGGDVSEALAECPHPLTDSEIGLLSDLLKPCRRDALLVDWEVPFHGWRAMDDDWDHLEACLRQISDFLHDGVSLRPHLSDQLDLLAEEASDACDEAGVDGLRMFLFESGRFKGNHEQYQDPRNSDLAWVIEKGKSNPIGLACIFLLVARRLDIDVDGVNFPGHFLCRVEHGGQQLLVDCFNSGRIHDLNEILNRHDDIDDTIATALTSVASPGEILIRTLRNLELSLQRHEEAEDAELIHRLIESLKP